METCADFLCRFFKKSLTFISKNAAKPFEYRDSKEGYYAENSNSQGYPKITFSGY